MSSFSPALSRTLQSISATKINEVSKQQMAFEGLKRSILQAADQEVDERGKVRVLLDGLKFLRPSSVSLDGCEQDDIVVGLSGLSSKNIKRFLGQSQFDPSVSTSLLQAWETRLRRELDIQSLKYDYASLFGRLVTEWLSNLNDGTRLIKEVNPEEQKRMETDSPDIENTFEQVGRKEMYDQREKWEAYVFTSFETNVVAIESYLSELFTASREARLALEKIRQGIKKFQEDLMSKPGLFDSSVLEWCIKGLLEADLLSDEKRTILMEFSINNTVLTEVADVLNMHLASLDTWAWDPIGVPVELRRKLNGKYRVFTDEDILQALLLQYIGVQWGVQFKQCFTAFFHSRAWKQVPKRMTKRARERRDYFLGDWSNHHTIQAQRRRMYETDYFMTLLPGSVSGSNSGYGMEANGDNVKSIKESLLHLLSTESLVYTRLYGELSIILSDFNWFGPSLPHSTIFAVLAFFGVSDQWMNFFKRFLQAPLKFAQDGPDAEAKLRRRGVPLCHALSDVFGEVVLFVMDYAVNQRTGGALLYRLHDDIWFWGHEGTCVEAWDAMTRFTEVMGLSFNKEKTGAVRIIRDEVPPPVEPRGLLPQGEIRWGFLKLDPNTGKFVVDQGLVDQHIEELERQLWACKSIFAWVQAWNSYFARFFAANFGRPANCFGRSHLDMILETFQRVQCRLFSNREGTGGSVTGYLRKLFGERFGVNDIPDGFFYFPVEMGGLELHNPVISLFAMRERICKIPMSRLEEALDEEKEAYRQAEEAFADGTMAERRVNHPTYIPDDAEVFMSLEEFTMYSDETSTNLRDAYDYFLSVPEEEDVELSPEVSSALQQLAPLEDGKKGKIDRDWATMSPYYKWVVQLYGTEMIQKFGGLSVVDRGLLPVGIVDLLRTREVRWLG